MSSSAQLHLEGSIYYITVVVYDRLAIFTHPAYITPLYDSLNYYRHKREFKLLGYVIPDHLHLLIWPHNDGDLGETCANSRRLRPNGLSHKRKVSAIMPA